VTDLDVRQADTAAWQQDEITQEAPAAHAAGSILGQLAARRAELAQGRKPLDLEVPGYSGKLWVRYRFVSYEVMAKASARFAKEKLPDEQRDLVGCIETLITCCDEVMVADDAGVLRPLAAELGDPRPVRFDDTRLADVLGYEATRAREVVRGLFENEYAIITQAAQVSEWLASEAPEVDRDLLGESGAAAT
jgi:hypothetical protein